MNNPNAPVPARSVAAMQAARTHATAAGSLGIAGLALCAHFGVQAADVCSARSPPAPTPVVELYTSEGCNSCPPADKWLSRLKADPAIVALAFHVDYWDRLGWKDRFASPAYTQRQAQQQSSSGARFSYTPQVIIDGADRKDWSSIGSPVVAQALAAAPVELTLSRVGQRVSASVVPTGIGAAPRRLAAYWAVTEQDHVTAVQAGENDGATLHHDYVVREYRPVAAWPVRPGSAATLVYELPASAAVHSRQVNLVVVDAETGRPVQALKIGC